MKIQVDQGLDTLRSKLAEMAAHVEIALSSSVHAVKKLSHAEVLEVIEGDHIIDDFKTAIEENSVQLFLACQPAERDLRQIMAIVKVSGKLERVGNLTVNVAECVENMIEFGDDDIVQLDFSMLSSQVYSMLHEALDALIYHDSQRALHVMQADDTVDEMHRQNCNRFLELILSHPNHGKYYLSGLSISHCLERIADIAADVAEDVIYFENGSYGYGGSSRNKVIF